MMNTRNHKIDYGGSKLNFDSKTVCTTESNGNYSLNENSNPVFDCGFDRSETSLIHACTDGMFEDRNDDKIAANFMHTGESSQMATSRSLFSADLKGDILVDPALDEHFNLDLDCSSSYNDSMDPNLFRKYGTSEPKKITDALTFVKKLGQGVYGDVFLCHLRDNMLKQFAVKRVRQAPTPVENIFGLEQNIIKELHALRSLKRPHMNIVRLYDYCSAIEKYNNHVPSSSSGSSNNTKTSNSKDGKKSCIVFYFIFELCDMDLNQYVKQVSQRYKNHENELYKDASKDNDQECKIQDLIHYSRTVYLKKMLRESQASAAGQKSNASTLDNDKSNKSSVLDDKIPLPALDEEHTKVIMYQLLQGLAYLHSHRIIHRDIKPQNVLLKKNRGTFETFSSAAAACNTEGIGSVFGKSSASISASASGIASAASSLPLDKSPHLWQVKIGDLGLSTVIPARYLSHMTEEVVTLLYRPPELLLGDCKYTTAVDVWSTAVTVGECLLGKPMFRGRTEFSVLMRIICTIGMPSPSEMPELAKELKYMTGNIPCIERDAYDSLRKMMTDHFGRQLISETGLDLFVKMLRFVPSKRLTAQEALKHPWFNNISTLLKPSIAKMYLNTSRVIPKGHGDLVPLALKGDVKEYKRRFKNENRLEKSRIIDDCYTQFVFPQV